MVVRLGFAVVAASNPELLITDEVLAVGDESFQKKCVRWIESFLEQGNTLLMVSHSMFLVQKLCRQALWLHEGRMKEIGDVFPVTQAYLAWHEERSAAERRQRSSLRGDSGLYRVSEFSFPDRGGDSDPVIASGGDLVAELVLHAPDGRAPVALLGVMRADGTPVYGVSSEFDGIEAERLDEHRFRFRIRFERLPLLPGSYSMRGHAMDPQGMRLCDTAELRFSVAGESREMGILRLPHRWENGD